MTSDMEEQRTRAKIDELLHVCKRKGPILVLTQDNPDPDAMASGAALREIIRVRLKKRVVIGYGGIAGRAENRAMIDLLHIGARRLTEAQLDRFGTICLVDAQPHSGNNLLGLGRTAHVVIDHHLSSRKRTWDASFVDIRPHIGATSTILFEYLRAANVPMNTNLATALFYGIQSDTQDLGREASSADVRAYQELFLLADKKKLARIHHAPVSIDYFKMLAASLADCLVAGTTIISCIHACKDVDMIAEVADRMLHTEGVRTTVCYGLRDNVLYLSARALDARGNVARRMRRVVKGLGSGGGHATMAGGQVPLGTNAAAKLDLIRERIFSVFAPGKPPVPLLSLKSARE